jgi:hypothetical protein
MSRAPVIAFSRLRLAIALAASLAVADAEAHRSVASVAGVRAYRYEVQDIAPQSTTGYRLDFRLRTEASGDQTAEVVRAWGFDGKTWTPVTVDAACAAALHARPGELAVVPLYPMTPERAQLGDAFLANCAPSAVFLPLTDVLNVVLIEASDRFHLRDLRSVGQSAPFPGFSTSLHRPGLAMTESSDGGATTLVSRNADRVVVDWAPSISSLDLVEQDAGGPGQPVHLVGTEHFAFRVTIDAPSGSLESATTLYDDLNLTVIVPGLADAQRPRIASRRVVTIEPFAVP